MKIRLKYGCTKKCPGDHVPQRFKKRQLIKMSFLDSEYPGKPCKQGSLAWTHESKQQKTDYPVYTNWVFWSTEDRNFALIFRPDDIDALYLTKEEYNQLPAEAISSATFEIIVERFARTC